MDERKKMYLSLLDSLCNTLLSTQQFLLHFTSHQTQSAYLLIWVRQLVQTVREGNGRFVSHSSQGQSQNHIFLAREVERKL